MARRAGQQVRHQRAANGMVRRLGWACAVVGPCTGCSHPGLACQLAGGGGGALLTGAARPIRLFTIVLPCGLAAALRLRPESLFAFRALLRERLAVPARSLAEVRLAIGGLPGDFKRSSPRPPQCPPDASPDARSRCLTADNASHGCCDAKGPITWAELVPRGMLLQQCCTAARLQARVGRAKECCPPAEMPGIMNADAMRLGAPGSATVWWCAHAGAGRGDHGSAQRGQRRHRVGDQVVFNEAAEAVPRRGRVQHMMLPACAEVRARAQAGSGGGERDGAGGTQPAVAHPKGVPQHASSITG